jgi:inner membrane protein
LDNLTHTLTGVLLGRAGLKRLTGRATATLVISSNLPDIDSWVAPLFGLQPIAVHRGFTHGIGGLVTLPFLTVAMIILWEKLRPDNDGILVRFWPSLLVAFIGGLGHSALDWLTGYGTRLLDPLSQRWFYGDAWFIVDPWVWIIIIVGLELSWRAERRGGDWDNPAIGALAVICAYASLNIGITQRMETAAGKRLAAAHPTMVVANPQPLLFWRRTILWRNSHWHGSGTYDLIHGLRLDREVEPNNLADPRLAKALQASARVRAFMFWSRMPVVVERDRKAFLTDQRFATGPSARRGGPFLIPLG